MLLLRASGVLERDTVTDDGAASLTDAAAARRGRLDMAAEDDAGMLEVSSALLCYTCLSLSLGAILAYVKV
jgi:hypothetical protein